MCGIAGYSGFQPSDPTDTLKKFNESIKHRGPDASGFWHENAIGLSHTRLSILDLSDAGTQPMHSKKNNLHLVFNGEIYNFLELKKKLPSYEFNSNSDTEVLLNYITEFGITKTLADIDGMYAFALYDGNDKSLYLARDRMGQKPLFYWHDKGQLIFGSELSVIKSYLKSQLQVDQNGLSLFWKYGYIPTPHTAYKNVYKLPQASLLHYKDQKITTTKYWQCSQPSDQKSTMENTLEQLDHCLKTAVQQRLISDAPIGVFLSGGLDSAIITSYAKDAIGDLKTFSMGMDDKTFDESEEAQFSANHFKTNHFQKKISFDFESDLPQIVKHFGEPYGDPSSLPTYHLSRITAEHVKVALSGDGADELFGGYYRYLIREKMDAFSKVPAWLRNPAINLLSSIKRQPPGFYGNSFFKKLALFNHRANLIKADPNNIVPINFSPTDQKLLLPEAFIADQDPILGHINQFKDLKSPHQMMWVDTMMYLESDINIKVDRMSMAHGLEVRSPFLSHHLCELVAQLSYHDKVNNNQQKHLLKQAVAHRIPPQVSARPKKGFGLPLGMWFQSHLKGYFEKNIINNENNPFSKPYLKTLWSEHQKNRHDHGLKFWQLCIYNEWLNQNG